MVMAAPGFKVVWLCSPYLRDVTMWKRALAFLVLLPLACPVPVFAESNPDWASVINMAGRQRMLTQRITGSYIQAGLGANAVIAREQLARSLDQFEKQHAELVQVPLTGEIRNTLEQIEVDWVKFKALATGGLTRSSVKQLVALDEKLLQACERLTHALEELSGTRQGRLVNISGRQRMLSQRLVKNYMLLAAGLAGQATVGQLGDDKREFRKSLNTLMSERNYSREISEKLDRVAEQWVWVESALDSMSENYYPIIVADAGEKILVLLESLTQMYAMVKSGQGS